MFEDEIAKSRGLVEQYEKEIAQLSDEIGDFEIVNNKMPGKSEQVDQLRGALLEKIRSVGQLGAGLKLVGSIETLLTDKVSGESFASFKGSVSTGNADVKKEIEMRQEEIEKLKRSIEAENSNIEAYLAAAKEAEDG